MCKFSTVSELKRVWLADHTWVPVLGKGDVMVDGPNGPVILRDVQFIPALAEPLMSLAAVYDHGGRVRFTSNTFRLYSRGALSPVSLLSGTGLVGF